MCDWGALQRITIRQSIVVDACLADLIVTLNEQGVRTTGCCCGHGKGPGSVTITPSSIERASELGYCVALRGDFDPEIVLGNSDAAIGRGT
jgi:hypothetical protein